MADEEKPMGAKCPLCKGKGKECKMCMGKGTIKVTFESGEGLDYLKIYVDEILEALYEANGVRPLFISDGSAIGDFFEHCDEEDEERGIKKMARILGVKISPTDLIVDIAKRLRDR